MIFFSLWTGRKDWDILHWKLTTWTLHYRDLLNSPGPRKDFAASHSSLSLLPGWRKVSSQEPTAMRSTAFCMMCFLGEKADHTVSFSWLILNFSLFHTVPASISPSPWLFFPFLLIFFFFSRLLFDLEYFGLIQNLTTILPDKNNFHCW